MSLFAGDTAPQDTDVSDDSLRRINLIANRKATPHVVGMGASTSQVIPIGAFGWTFSILTGTATINGATVPASFSDNDPSPLLATITINTATASSAYVRWNT